MAKQTTDKLIDYDLPKSKSRKLKEYKPEYANIAARLSAAGFSEDDLAYTLDVSKTHIQSWKKSEPQFKEACEEGRRAQKKRLVAKGINIATGYRYVDKNVKRYYNAEGELIKTEESEFQKEQTPNERMLIFLLCNLDRQLGDNEWQSVKKLEIDEKRNITVQIDGKSAKQQIQALVGSLMDEPRKQVESKVVELESLRIDSQEPGNAISGDTQDSE